MKTKFDSSEIAHIWANQSAPYGRSSSALSFDGPLLNSYTTTIARLVEHKGKKAVVINDRSFSVTTTKHQSRMYRAIPQDLPKFYFATGRLSSLNPSAVELFDYAISKAAESAGKAINARKPERYLATQGHWLSEAQKVSNFFGLRRKVSEKQIARAAKAKAKAEKEAAKAAKECEAKAQAEYSAAFEAWKTGGGEYFPHHLFPIAFRVEGEELVSTLGARVPLDAAKRAIRFATSKRGQQWRENGETCEVGNYKLNAINEQGVVAGCHRISWAEIDRLSSILS